MENNSRDTINGFSNSQKIADIPKRERQLASYKNLLGDNFTDEEKNVVIETLLNIDEMLYGEYIKSKNRRGV